MMLALALVFFPHIVLSSDLVYQVFNQTNANFGRQVYGNQNHTFWEYVDTVLELPSQSGHVDIIAVLNNTFTYELSLHYVRASSDGIIQTHQMPRTYEEPNENDTIIAQAQLNQISGFEILDYTEKEDLHVENLHKDYSLVRGRGRDDNERIVDITLVNTPTETRHYIGNITLTKEIAGEHPVDQWAVMLALFTICVLMIFLTYTCIWCVYKRKGVVFCFKKSEHADDARLNLGIEPSS